MWLSLFEHLSSKLNEEVQDVCYSSPNLYLQQQDEEITNKFYLHTILEPIVYIITHNI